MVTVDEPSVSPADWWRPALEGTPVLHGHHAKPAGHGADPNAPRDGIAVRLAAKEAVEQVLIVSDRTFEEETFGAEDLQVFQTLAMHAAMAMDRAGMTERLTRLAADRAHEAMHDPLTGLPNRRAFNDAVDAAMTSADRGTASGVVLLLDIDDFKDVNDTLGHSAGDRLLVVTGERLQAIGGGVVARLGGDEFAVLLPGEDAAAGLAHARELHAVLSRPVPLADVLLTTSASIGVAEYQGASCSSDDLLARADVAMYAAKAERSGVAAYRPEDGNSTARRLALAADLPRALDSGALTLWYQPQARGTTGEVTGFEALLRWEHPEYGLVPPPEVVAVAQRTGLVRALTDHLVRQALDARKEWSDHGLDLDVSVNVTPRDVADLDFVDRVTEALTATSTRPEALVLEITESDAMRDPERALQVLEALAAVGVRLSVDDFGTGYSSLAYLDRLPVHEVKIDQSFVFRIEQQPADSTIVRATVSLAHELGLRVVAEGVENDLAKTLMAELGCDLYQGFGLARPMPAGDVVTWVSRHRSHARGPVRDLDRSVGRLTGSPAAPW